jgi:N-acetyl-anhydromuramyl-L-alanine amidase AmpD
MEQNANNNASRTRTVRTEEQILKLLEEFEANEYSVKDFCMLSDINEATFYSWQKKYRSKESDDEKGFSTIEVVAADKPQLFAEIGNLKLYREVSAEYLKTLLS